MPVPGGLTTVEHGGHLVQFYRDDQELARSVARFLGDGLAVGGSAVAIATAPHRLSFQAQLQHDAPQAASRLTVVDAEELLHRFLDGNQLDHARFREAATGVIEQAASAGEPVRVYGEMVAVLWDAGQVELALELEGLWNDLARDLPFTLLCGYPASLLTTGGEPPASAVQQVCHLHTSVISPPPVPADSPAVADAAARRFPAALSSAPAARSFVHNQLGSPPLEGAGADAVIVAAELAANAVLHARSEFTITVSRLPDAVRISVRDQKPASGTIPAAQPGHGLHVVAQIAKRWGIDPLPDGKTVWADVPAPGHDADVTA